MQESIVVQYVNQPKPGKKKGSIKSTAGKTYGVWPDKLDQFQPGGSYTVEVEENQYNGQTYYGVKRIIGAPSNGNATPAPSPAPYTGRQTDEATAERIYVCGIVNAAVPTLAAAGDLRTGVLIEITNTAREAWRQTFGGRAEARAAVPPDDPQAPF
jgi:hypothetical protein